MDFEVLMLSLALGLLDAVLWLVSEDGASFSFTSPMNEGHRQQNYIGYPQMRNAQNVHSLNILSRVGGLAF
jgi:hypothetical protein